MDKFHKMCGNFKESFKKNFKFSTTEMIFVLIFVNLFQLIFGAENSIIGVIFVIIMACSMMRDMTAFPIRHFVIQMFVLLGMTIAACMVNNFSYKYALIINFFVSFIILYSYTYEYASNLYFPYILSYLFMIFISPVNFEQLPKRLIGVTFGCIGIIIYQFIRGRNRVERDTKNALLLIINEVYQYVDFVLNGKEPLDNKEIVRKNLCKLSKIVYNRRKSPTCVSDASFAMIDCGRGFEHLILLLDEIKPDKTPEQAMLMEKVLRHMDSFKDFVENENNYLIPLKESDFYIKENKLEKEIFNSLLYIYEHMLKMTDPKKRTVFRKSILSLEIRLKNALDISFVRVFYALRVAVLITVCTYIVQKFQLTYGRWLLFTVASVSLPYADDVGKKAKQRFIATIVGGFTALVLFSLVQSPIGRTLIMILSGYLSFYFSSYTQTFSFSTIGALGGAVFMNAFEFNEIGSILIIRIGYICLGIIIAYIFNCVIFPFKRNIATKLLWKRYIKTISLLSKTCHQDDVDTQMYYNLVIQSHMIEEKLSQNAYEEGFEEVHDMFEKYRNKVRNAHRKKALEMLSLE